LIKTTVEGKSRVYLNVRKKEYMFRLHLFNMKLPKHVHFEYASSEHAMFFVMYHQSFKLVLQLQCHWHV